jgi:hypothetical protein
MVSLLVFKSRLTGVTLLAAGTFRLVAGMPVVAGTLMLVAILFTFTLSESDFQFRPVLLHSFFADSRGRLKPGFVKHPHRARRGKLVAA